MMQALNVTSRDGGEAIVAKRWQDVDFQIALVAGDRAGLFFGRCVLRKIPLGKFRKRARKSVMVARRSGITPCGNFAK
jgi:hypothetical protein